MNSYRNVFSPIRIGRVELKNRIAVSPMLPCMATPDGYATRELIEYYQGYARGGAAIVNLGDTCVDSVYGRGHYGELILDSDKVLGGLSNIAEAIHKFGAKATIELNHPGRMANPARNEGRNPIAPSPVPHKGEILLAAAQGREPFAITEMDHSLIGYVIEKFAEACGRCLSAGFEMVMLHGGHGQLLAQFASPHSNKRTDEYGGTLENRARFINEVLTAVRNKVGDRLAIEYRISADEIIPDGMHIEETIEFIRLIQDKLDLVHLSVGMLSDPELIPHMAQPAYFPHEYNVLRAEKVKKAVKIPVACVGSIVDLAAAERIIAEGRADIVAMGRAHVADPEIVNKTYRGEADTVRPCVRCNMCGERIPFSMPVRCTVNPVIGREVEHKYIRKAGRSRKVVIIGGGPAGMQAAITASSRGHDVVLFEKEKNLGGKIIMAASPQFKQDMKRYLDWLVRSVNRSGADIRLSAAASADNVKAEKPDVIIIAAGAEPIIPDIDGISNEGVVWAGDVDMGRVETGKTVVVVGAGMTGCETALHLAGQGKKVTLVDLIKESEFAGDASGAARIALIGMLIRENVEFVSEAKLAGITDTGAVFLDKNGDELIKLAGTIVLSLGMKPLKKVANEFPGIASEIYVIGDCKKAGNLKNAVHDAFNIAVEL